jgi:hypothetical protein
MARFKQQVDATAEAALLDVQRRISQAQQQQAQVLGQAEQYLQELSSTEARVVSCLQRAPAAHTGALGTHQAQQQVKVHQQGVAAAPHADVLLSTEAPLSPRGPPQQQLGDLELAVMQLLQGAANGKKRRQQQQQEQHPDADASQLAKQQKLAAAGPCSQAAATAAAAAAVIVID